MARMNRVARWFVNRRTGSRARRSLARLGGALQLPEGSHVLELGSGGGGMLALLEERFHPARLIGTDYDPDQIEVARRYLAGRWSVIPSSLELRTADALKLPFPDGSFDAVFAMLMLHHVEAHHTDYLRRPDALREIRRVLRPNGQLVYSEIVRRAETRQTLTELGFEPVFLTSGWHVDLAIYRRPTAPATPPSEIEPR